MPTALRLAALLAFGSVSVTACGSSTLQPVRELDGGIEDAPGATPDAVGQGSDDGGAPDGAVLPPADAAAHDAGHLDAGAHVDAGAAPRCKRGIAANAAPTSALAKSASGPGVTWWYDWSNQGTSGTPAIAFVPMIWGSAALAGPIPAGASYLLGFNEPNFKAQSNLTPQAAAADWPKVEALAKPSGIPLVAPAVNYCGSASNTSGCSDPSVTDPYTWLKDFFAACPGCEVDYVAVHWYNCDLPSLQAYIEGNTASGGGLEGFVQFGKPIWLTEFSCDGSHTAAQQTAYMQAAIPWLEANAHVFRYSWFSAGPIASAVLTNADGSLTDLGKTYVGLPGNCP